MKQLIFTLLIVSSLATNAQVVTETITGTSTRTTAAGTTVSKIKGIIRVDSNAVVKDSAGTRYAYSDWHKLVMTGQYALRSNNRQADSAKEFTLVKKSTLEIARTKMMMAPLEETGIIKTGEPLELFNAKDINGYKIDPKSLAGKVVVLNFWFIACPPCREEIPELNKIVAAYANNPDVVFIGIATDETDKLKDFLKDTPFAYHIVSDGSELATKYGIKGYPTNVIVGKDGKVKLHTMGYGPYSLDGFAKAIDNAK